MMATIAECALRSGLLVGMVWLVLKVLRIRSPRLERSAWLAVLASSLAMPVLIRLPALPAAAAPDLPWLQHREIAVLPLARSDFDWSTALLWIVIAVAALLFIRHSLGVIRWWEVRRMARPIASLPFTGVDVRVTAAVNSPATVFSTVLVPVDFEALAPEAQRAAIAHERAHVENGDFYVQWLAQAHRCFFWFSPLAWWLASRLSILSEHISDDTAIAQTKERVTYVEVLLAFAQRAARNAPLVGDPLVTMASGKSLASRIERILAEGKPPQASRRKTLLLLSALLPLIGSVVGFQSVAARSKDDSNEDRPELWSPTTRSPATGEAVAWAAGSAVRVVLPRSNPKKPLSAPMYPPASRRLGEHGTVVLKLHVLEDGSVADAAIAKSSGYPHLDYAAFYEALQWRLDAGTIDDTPTRMWGRFAVTFKLANEEVPDATPSPERQNAGSARSDG